MTSQETPAFHRVDVLSLLSSLQHRTVNYTIEEVARPAWKIDSHRVPLVPESPGDPEVDGPWHTACRLVSDYEFCPPEMVRATFDPGEPLLGRNMLLEGRFSALRLYLPVRITDVIDERRPSGHRVWGFSYETLDGHLERGRLSYEVVKDEHSGRIEFAIAAYSQRARTVGPVLTLGWTLFGRRRQLHFYRRCGYRMQELIRNGGQPASRPPRVQPPPRLALAPSDARSGWLDPMALHSVDPG